MKRTRYVWIAGLLATLAVIIIPIAIFWPRDVKSKNSPLANEPPPPKTQTSHVDLMTGPYETPQDVTKACLECHPDAATDIMTTSHWTWESQPFNVSWRDEPVTIGKANQINNFCISAQGNQKQCMSCHAGYSWEEGEEYDFSNQLNVDCLACHADPNTYAKGEYGNPVEGVDLVAAAQSTQSPTRQTCGKCHFDGGGGNNVKHGDLSQQLIFPADEMDVHMGAQDFQCITCHTTDDHQIKGRLQVDNIIVNPEEQTACTDCHKTDLHDDQRINEHVASVACETCHIPRYATKDPTKMSWDWSTSGQDLPEDHYTFLKIKGTFEYDKNVKPVYLWSNGDQEYRYLLGDKIDPSQTTYINIPDGDIDDPEAKITPFKVHTTKQPYDTGFNYLLAPITAGDNGYWTTFDWDLAFELAELVTGLEYSGGYAFAETEMYWPISHLVQPAKNALQCTDCHSVNGRMDWQALGYPGDPMVWGGRNSGN